MTVRSRSRTGSGRRKKAFSALKMAVLTPMPSASESTATVTKPGCRASERRLCRMSWTQELIERTPVADYYGRARLWLTTSNGLQELDDLHALLVCQQRTDDAPGFRRCVAEFVAAVAVAGQRRVELRRALHRGRIEPNLHWIEFLAAHVERGRPIRLRREQQIQVGHRSVVQVGAVGPDAVERTCLVDHVVAHHRVAAGIDCGARVEAAPR